jgi:peptide/nickel transport system permease protein
MFSRYRVSPNVAVLGRAPALAVGVAILVMILLFAFFAPYISSNPLQTAPSMRLQPPSASHLFGTDNLGRDIFARTAYGARSSLQIGVIVSVISSIIGLAIGLFAGMSIWVDNIVSRILDGLMAIPAILLAIALVSLTRGGIFTIAIAIAVPEIPRVVRLIRSVVLSTKELQFVEASIASGATLCRITTRHIFPFTLAPIVVQSTFICASAILLEAGLSFLGAGLPSDVPSWGGMIAGGRLYILSAPWIIAFPGAALALVILAVNLVGDGLRDRLDPRLRGKF